MQTHCYAIGAKTGFVTLKLIDHLDSKTLPSFCTQVDIMVKKIHSLIKSTGHDTIFHRLSILIHILDTFSTGQFRVP